MSSYDLNFVTHQFSKFKIYF